MAFRVALLAALVLGACSSAGAPSGAPSITGTITRVSSGAILVEERPDERSGSDKASLRLTDSTAVWRQTATGRERASVSDLREGQRVEAWYDGPVAESYPVQTKAGIVLILAR